jgi:HK97 family phage prohead protease
MARERISCPFELKSVDDAGTFTGYASVFGVVDWWDDVVEAGAFADSLKARSPAMLWQHNMDEPIGTWPELKEDEHGLWVKGSLLVNGVARAAEAHVLLKAGALNGLSIGYNALERYYRKEGERDVRVLKKVDLWEISLVTSPANEQARVRTVKAMEDLRTVRDVEEYLREAGSLSRSEAKGVIARVRDVLQREAEEKAILAGATRLLNLMREG